MFRVEKVIKKKYKKLYAKLKGYDNSFSSWIDQKILLQKIDFYPDIYGRSNIKVELCLSNYTTNLI